MVQPPDLNNVEYVCCILCMGMQAACLAFRKAPLKHLLPALLAMVPAALFAAAAFTRFLSWDESYLFYDIVNYRSSRLPQWEMGAFRTTITLMGPFFSALQEQILLTKDIVLVLVKAAHWLMGIMIITVIIDQVYRFFAPKVPYSFFHAVLFNAIMFLPVTELALKTLNYDLISMLLGLLGCMWCAAGMQSMRSGRAGVLFAAVIALTLAAHEKLIASPLLWAGIIFSAARLAYQAKNPSWRALIVRTGFWSAMATASSLLLIGSSFIVVALTHGANGPGIDADQLFVAFTSCLWPIRQLLSANVPGQSFISLFDSEARNVIFGFAALSATATVAALFVCLLHKLCGHLHKRTPSVLTAAAMVAYAKLSLLLFITVTGVTAGYLLKVNILPLVPVLPGHFVPHATFNGIAHHFGCTTLVGHTIASTAWACAVFINALPTVLLALLFTGCMARVIAVRNAPSSRSVRPLDLLALVFMTAPVLYGALQIPLFPRYLNLFLLGAVVAVIPDIFSLKIRQPLAVTGITVLGLLLILGESLSFQPLGATFRPVWSNYSKEFNADPSFGKVSPWYPGWGEELFIAYNRINKMKTDHAEPITLFHNFPAALIRSSARFRTSAMPVGHGQLNYSYGDEDYYVLSRNGISSYTYIEFPYGIRPVFTIADRGFVKAWVFRGSDLAEKGFRFRDTCELR